MKPFLPLLLLHLLLPCLSPATEAPLPPDSAYVRVNNGHLAVDGKRERYWAAIGKLFLTPQLKPTDTPEERGQKIADAKRGTDLLLERFQDLGFNAFRLYAIPSSENYTPGDGSATDSVDYFVAKAREKGFRIWMYGLNKAGVAVPEDASIVEDPKTEAAWKEAIVQATAKPDPKQSEKSSSPKIDVRKSLARVWDPRLEAVYIRNLTKIINHRNKHTGLRWADDPVFAVWELTNEEWWMRKMLGGQWQKEVPFFRQQLVSEWNAWLKKKYGDNSTLLKTWGELLPQENLAGGSILLAPMGGKVTAVAALNDSNQQAKASVEGISQSYDPSDFPSARASDVIAFFLDLQLTHKRKVAAAVKACGKSCALSPMIYDTGIGYEIHSQFLHQNADAVAHDAYVNGYGPAYEEPDLSDIPTPQQAMVKQLGAERVSSNTGPWTNWLLKPPGIAQGVPWLEHNRVEGKPYLAYETQIQQPAKYRVDYPFRIAALAAIQDWDWICWHYFAAPDSVGTEERPFDRPMDLTYGKHPQGYHYTFDEVQNASMRSAAMIFRQGLLQKAASPTKFIYGRKSLLARESMSYAGSYGERGMDMLQTTYQYGSRIEIDPNREEDEIQGPVVSFADRNTHNPYTPTSEITFDWKKGFLKMESPNSVTFAGLLANQGGTVSFPNGVRLEEVTFSNPPGIFSPITDDEKYLAFSLQTEDGKPLAEAIKASISLVSTSFNSGFSAPSDSFFQDGQKIEGAIKPGGTPVLVTRVGALVSSSDLNGMRFLFRDWHWNEIGSGVITDGALRIPSDLPIFCVELMR